MKYVVELRASGISPVEQDFYDKFSDCGNMLPAGLGRFLAQFRQDRSSAVCQVHGFPVDDVAVGPTPAHWERQEGHRSTLDSDIYLAMCATALGSPFAWATLQRGRMVQDIFPIRGDEQRESGHGSQAFLMFHTDDAFRPDSCDYLLLFGIRNHDHTPTYVASVRDVCLSDDDRQLLNEERFHIVPDDEHIRQLELRTPDAPALQGAREMRDHPQSVPVLFGDPDDPFVRLDAPYMRCVGDDPDARRALAALAAELERVRRPVVVAPGSLLVLDNHIGVHARESFTARYDGTDRWLRKIIVSRDLSGEGLGSAGRIRF
ncbi:TauD/TfdA family dioxygenase [Streptomyces sp. DT193]|uniref:TauD/TfdA family dioxygenase n=1 Tax=Streptomyces sp. DT193 TaxID=3393418 RepID=UPI003CF1CD7A